MNKRNLISSVMTILMPMFLFGQVVTEEKVETSIGDSSCSDVVECVSPFKSARMSIDYGFYIYI